MLRAPKNPSASEGLDPSGPLPCQREAQAISGRLQHIVDPGDRLVRRDAGTADQQTLNFRLFKNGSELLETFLGENSH